jgi:hypothetical protein
VQAVHLLSVLPAHEAAFERLDYGANIPPGPVAVPEQILYARPAGIAIELTRIAVIEKLTMQLAYIIFVLLAVFYLHSILPNLIVRMPCDIHDICSGTTDFQNICSEA